MGEEVAEFVRLEDVERQGHGIIQTRHRAGCQFSDERLDLGECHLDWVKIRRKGLKVLPFRPGSLDGLCNTGDLIFLSFSNRGSRFSQDRKHPNANWVKPL